MAKTVQTAKKIEANPVRIVAEISPNKTYAGSLLSLINSIMKKRQKLIDEDSVSTLGIVFLENFWKDLEGLDESLNISEYYRVSNTKNVINVIIEKIKILYGQVYGLPSNVASAADSKKLEDAERNRRDILRYIRTLGVEKFLLELSEALSNKVTEKQAELPKRQGFWQKIFGR